VNHQYSQDPVIQLKEGEKIFFLVFINSMMKSTLMNLQNLATFLSFALLFSYF